VLKEKIWSQPIRIGFLAVTFCAVLLGTIKVVFIPGSTQPVGEFNFPDSVNLEGWQLESSSAIATVEDSNRIAARNYQYSRNDRSVDIQMHYIVQTEGDIRGFIKQYLKTQTLAGTLAVRERENIGTYQLWASGDRAYLSACINPRGETTVTGDQFRQNRNSHDLTPPRILLWLIGQQELRDFTCLWTVLSATTDPDSLEQTYSTLENVWFSWYQQWRPLFPSS